MITHGASPAKRGALSLPARVLSLGLTLIACGSQGSVEPGAAPPGANGAAASPRAVVVAIHELPPTSLKVLNPGLSDEDLRRTLENTVDPGSGRVKGQIDNPSLGSGLFRLADGTYYMMTDRGINDDHHDDQGREDGKTFPLPSFAPAIVKVRLEGTSLLVERAIPLRSAGGEPISGLPNQAGDQKGFLNLRERTPLPVDPSGMDVEEVVALPGGDLVLGEEYGPSIVVARADGRVKVRYTPAGRELPGAVYPVRPILPAALAHYRHNRGFECLALSRGGSIAYAVLESPLGSRDDDRYSKTRAVRVLRLDLSDPLRAAVTGHFIVLQSPAGAPSDGVAFAEGARQHDIKFSSAAWLGPDRLLLLEHGPGLVKVRAVDLRGATNLLGHPAENTLDLEDTTTAGKGHAALFVTPATSAVVLTSLEVPEMVRGGPRFPAGTDKWEGLSIVDSQTLALANDNDFGIVDNRQRSTVWIVRLGSRLDLAVP